MPFIPCPNHTRPASPLPTTQPKQPYPARALARQNLPLKSTHFPGLVWKRLYVSSLSHVSDQA